MIAGQSTIDLINKLKKFEQKIKEQAEIIRVQDIQIKDLGSRMSNNAEYIGKLKCRNADLKLAVRRKGGKVEDSTVDDVVQ